MDFKYLYETELNKLLQLLYVGEEGVEGGKTTGEM
jgi:hypothetical protein